MRASMVVYLGFVAVASLLTACGDCEAVVYVGAQADTVGIKKSGLFDCRVYAYAADSVGPKK